MFTLSHAIPVNPPGVKPEISREQIWRGLEMKVDDALPFVRGMTRCEVVERHDNVVVREVTFAGDSHLEKITLHAPVQVHFERVGEGGFIENTVSDSDQGLQLAFTFGLIFPGAEPGSPEERAKGEGMRGAYIGAVEATLARVRQMVSAGEL